MRYPRLMVIGLDAVSLTLLNNFQRFCPTIRNMMKKGVSGRAIPCFPIYTPTNWAAISTGADSSATTAEGWYNYSAGERLSTFDRRAIACDTIFDSSARAGLKTLAVMYPGAHPTVSPSNMVLAPLDRGLVSNCLVPGRLLDIKPGVAGVFAFDLMEAPESLSGAAMAKKLGATEDGAELKAKGNKTGVGRVPAWLFRDGKNAWKLGFFPDKRLARLTLRLETWSDPIPVKVAVSGRSGRCVVRAMVFDGGKRLAISEAYDIGELGKPESLAKAVYQKLGPSTEHSVFFARMEKNFHKNVRDDAVSRLTIKDLQQQAEWIVNAATLTQKITPFDVFYLHYHLPDDVGHAYLAAASGSPAYSKQRQITARDVIASSMKIYDDMIAGLLKLAGKDTTVLLVSDHGNVPNHYAVDIDTRLKETGLLKFRSSGPVCHSKSLAWKDSRVPTWIHVKAKEDTPQYEKLQEKVIDALLDWKSPDGKRCVAVALKKKDSHLLGYYGKDCGDITFHYNTGFAWTKCTEGKSTGYDRTGSNHGPQMPVTYSNISDNMSFFVLAGPGLKRGVRWDEKTQGPIRLIDLIPTMCCAADVPAPRHAIGAIRQEFFR